MTPQQHACIEQCQQQQQQAASQHTPFKWRQCQDQCFPSSSTSSSSTDGQAAAQVVRDSSFSSLCHCASQRARILTPVFTLQAAQQAQQMAQQAQQMAQQQQQQAR